MTVHSHTMARRLRFLGRQRAPITLGTPSKAITNGIMPFPTERGIARQVWFEGKLQQAQIAILLADRSVVDIQKQAPPIEWSDSRGWFNYRPSMAVKRRDGSLTIYESQWHAIVTEYGLKQLVTLIEPFARKLGYRSIVLETDRELRARNALFNADLMTTAASSPVDGRLRELVLVRAHAGGRTPKAMKDLVNGIAEGPEALRLIARLVFDGDLSLRDRSARIGPMAILVPSSPEQGY